MSGKVKNIIKGFTSGEPTEKWYKDRMEACRTCEYNSANIEPSKQSAITLLKLSTICLNDSVCTACGCCISKKARVPGEVCGMSQIGLTPKWDSIEISNPIDKNFMVTCKNEGIKLEVLQNTVAINIPFKADGNRVSFELLFTHRHSVKPISVTASCGCTTTNVASIDNKNFSTSVTVSTKGFTGLTVSKSLTCEYSLDGSGRSYKMPIKLIFNKIQ